MTQKKLKLLLIMTFSMAMLFTFPVRASDVSYSPELGAYSCFNIMVPTADYLQSNFSLNLANNYKSFAIGSDINPLGIQINRFKISLGASEIVNFSSNIYNSIYLKGFLSLGLNILLKYKINNKWNIGMQGRAFLCSYYPLKDFFINTTAQISAYYIVRAEKHSEKSIMAALMASYRKDIFTGSLLLGYSLEF